MPSVRPSPLANSIFLVTGNCKYFPDPLPHHLSSVQEKALRKFSLGLDKRGGLLLPITSWDAWKKGLVSCARSVQRTKGQAHIIKQQAKLQAVFYSPGENISMIKHLLRSTWQSSKESHHVFTE